MNDKHGRRWEITAYYSNTAEAPKTPNSHALTIEVGTDWQKDLEVRVLEQRPDIGRIEVSRA